MPRAPPFFLTIFVAFVHARENAAFSGIINALTVA